jgi:tetratricopeptide (TPR) repeat protein
MVPLVSALILLIGALLPSVAMAQGSGEWFCVAVSLQGDVEAKRESALTWKEVRLNEPFYSKDTVRVLRYSRAAFQLQDDTILRVDQNTVITFLEVDPEQHPFLKVIQGAVHVFSRTRKRLKVGTPFVNAAVEGTEFLITADETQASILVLDGVVELESPMGSLILTKGEQATADASQPPRLTLPMRRKDQAAWTIHYPSILDHGPLHLDQEGVAAAVKAWDRGDYPQAMSFLEKAAPTALVRSLRTEILLQVGRWREAREELEAILDRNPGDAVALSQSAVLHIARGDLDLGMDSARRAVRADDSKAAPHIALSYAMQAERKIDDALSASARAVRVEPGNGLAWARHAELLLATGLRKQAVEAAEKAVSLRPELARTQSVLGFAHLAMFQPREARERFERAALLDQADPLPRLGKGLALIREGRLAEGRNEMEVALGLNPGNSIVRSYLGNAYFAENRTDPALEQFGTAKELDPQDPTPFLYEAFVLQSLNRPAEALLSLQESIRRNDNRAVYRSTLLLDKDLAARSSSLGWIYNALNFDQLALKEGWVSVHDDPASFSAHRVLADSYGALPRHDTARTSALLKSQLLQPVTMNPVLPHMAEPELFIFEGAGPMDPGFNEFNPVFQSNGANLLFSGVAGGDGILGNEAVLSGLYGGLSFSLGQFHYQTDGFRENNDLEQDIANAFLQWSPDGQTSLQAEFRYRDFEQGDLPLRFDPDSYFDTLRQTGLERTYRFGLHHAAAPHSDFLGSVIVQNDQYTDAFTLPGLGFDSSGSVKGLLAEGQHLFNGERLNTIVGGGHYSARVRSVDTIQVPDIGEVADESSSRTGHDNLYLYGTISGPWRSALTLGASLDLLDGIEVERDQFNPKLGVILSPWEGTTIHGAAFRTLQRDLIKGQTIEPVQVAGFTQYYDKEGSGADSRLYGLGIHQRITSRLFAGIKGYRRESEIPYEFILFGEEGELLENEIRDEDWEEDIIEGYVNLVPHRWFTIDLTGLWEHVDRGEGMAGDGLFTKLTTLQSTLGASFFHPSGFRARLAGSYVDQEGTFGDPMAGLEEGEDDFWILDASVGFLLPNGRGLITLEAKNILDESFRYQSTDPANPRYYPDRLLLARLTLRFR